MYNRALPTVNSVIHYPHLIMLGGLYRKVKSQLFLVVLNTQRQILINLTFGKFMGNNQTALSLQTNNNPLSIFDFSGQNIRFECVNGICFACAKDICEALDISWEGKKTLSQISQSWMMGREIPDSLGRLQKTIFINQKAVMKLAFRSNKPEADNFVNWVCEILEKLSQGETVSLKKEQPQKLEQPKLKFITTAENLNTEELTTHSMKSQFFKQRIYNAVKMYAGSISDFKQMAIGMTVYHILKSRKEDISSIKDNLIVGCVHMAFESQISNN